MLSVVLLITLKERCFYFADLTLKVRHVKMQFISQNWQVAKILPTPDCTDGPLLGILDFLGDVGLVLRTWKTMQLWDY